MDWSRVSRWQLPNHVKRERAIGHKRDLATHLKNTPAMRWVPETYDLGKTDEAAAFVKLARAEEPRKPGRRVEILPVGPDFAMYFKRTTQAVQRCKNEQQRCSYGRDWVGVAGPASRRAGC